MSVEVSEDDILSFVHDVVKKITQEDEHAIIDKLFDFSEEGGNPANKATWLSVFTPSTFSTNDNYERLETLGDALLKTYFRKFLFNKDSSYMESDITNLSSHYMATSGQKIVAERLQLTKHVRLAVFDNVAPEEALQSIRDNLGADIYEGLIGAISVTSDRYCIGLSEIICTNMMRKIYGGDRPILPIEDKYRVSSLTTKVIQWLEGLGVKHTSADGSTVETNKKNKVILSEMKRGGEFIMYLDENQTGRLNQSLRELGSELGQVATKNFYASVVAGPTEVRDAYENLEKQLTDLGVTQEVVDYYRTREGRNLIEGYDYVTYEAPKKATGKVGSVTYSVHQLIGVFNDGKKEILYTACYAADQYKGKSRTEMLMQLVALYKQKYLS